ncbi:MAG: YitT family protein [Anaerolineae bacterium]|nr:YitT family protein [Anaerolineae bacterium]
MKKRLQISNKIKAGTSWVRRGLFPFILMVIGSFCIAFAYVMFQVPFNIVAGGLSGLALIINNFTGWSIGILYWVMNVPMFILGFIYLGRWQFIIRTVIATTIISVLIESFINVLPMVFNPFPVTDNMLLATIYGAIIGGIGTGLLFRAGATDAGTSIIGRILQMKTGLPLSQTYFFADGSIIFLAGLVFGWESALYGLMMMFIWGLASDFTLEGPSTTRIVTVITNHPQPVSDALLNQLGRGVSYWQITGAYTGEQHYMLTCTVSRPQVSSVHGIIAHADPDSFVTIGMSHNALGEGFTRIRKT